MALTGVVERARHPGTIGQLLEDAAFGGNAFVLGAVVQNPDVTSAILERIAAMERPELHRAMVPAWPVIGGER